ncbi:MAG: ATP-grasp domain-containing protein [Promethearchaeota archaeon]|nr:MAG: ATP-grasp domain-containing protein [Candidatus Lokiarchaeota archaeon]
MENLNIGILSKRKTMMAGKLKSCLKNKGFNISIYTLENLVINETLLNHDFYILKSKSLFFLYAGFFLEAKNKVVIPKPQISFIQKNRIQSHFLMRRIGLLTPEIYLGTQETLKNQLDPNEYPFILKPIMGSGSKGVKVINSHEEINSENNAITYLEKYIQGIHYNVYFIDEKICTLIKPPLANEHVDMKKIETPNDVKELIFKWKGYFKGNLLFGHLDIVREESSGNLYVVDPGSFPEFTNWKCDSSPVESICNLIIDNYRKTKDN